MEAARPRILVTGFSIFPGAPVNPTEALVGALRAAPPDGKKVAAFRAEVLAVEYATVAARLSELGRGFSPDIAIHFGLARACDGFRLERLARNTHAHARADQSGGLPLSTRVCDGPDTLPSTLPLESIAARLAAAGLASQWSDDAGGYLCNTVFTLSLAHGCEGLRPRMAGFVHVPPLKEAEPGNAQAMTLGDLVAGARIIIDTCAELWRP